MFHLNTIVSKGIVFIRLKGVLNEDNFSNFSEEINYLLYKQGIHYFVINFKEIGYLSQPVFLKLQNKLIEIFLSCGKVALCGLNEEIIKKIDKTKDRLFYITKEREAYKYLYL